MVQFKFSDKNTLGGVGKMGGKQAEKLSFKITPDEIKSSVLLYKKEILAAGGVLLSGIIIFSYISGQMAKVKVLSGDISLLSEKESPVTSLKTAVEADAALTSTIPIPLKENKFIPVMTSMAKKRSIILTSIAPPASEISSFFYRSYTNLVCRARNFKDAALFMNDIEKSEYSLKIDSWGIDLATPTDAGSSSLYDIKNEHRGKNIVEGSPELILRLKLSSIEILGNEKK
jgi:hypothetical protein